MMCPELAHVKRYEEEKSAGTIHELGNYFSSSLTLRRNEKELIVIHEVDLDMSNRSMGYNAKKVE